MLVGFFFISTVSRKRWQIHRKKSSNLNAFTHEDFSGIRVVQSFAAEQETSETFLQLCKEWRDAFVSAVRINDFFWPTVEMSWGVGTILVFWFGAGMIEAGNITPGSGGVYRLCVDVLAANYEYKQFYNQLVTNMSGAERIFEIIDIEPDIKDRPGVIPMLEIKGDVSFRNVTFGTMRDRRSLKM